MNIIQLVVQSLGNNTARSSCRQDTMGGGANCSVSQDPIGGNTASCSHMQNPKDKIQLVVQSARILLGKNTNNCSGRQDHLGTIQLVVQSSRIT